MAWGSDTAATQLTGITTEQFFNQVPTLNPRETAHVQVSVDFPSFPTDHLLVAVYTTLDDTSEVWDIIPMMEFLIENTTDPNRISFLVTGVYKFRVGVALRVDGHHHVRGPELPQGRRERLGGSEAHQSSLAQAAAVADPARQRRSRSALGVAHPPAADYPDVGARQRADEPAPPPAALQSRRGGVAPEHLHVDAPDQVRPGAEPADHGRPRARAAE